MAFEDEERFRMALEFIASYSHFRHCTSPAPIGECDCDIHAFAQSILDGKDPTDDVA